MQAFSSLDFTQILKDEEHHINFQAYTLAQIYQGRNFIRNFFSKCIHGVLLTGAIIVSYFTHKNLVKGAGMNFYQFCNGTFEEFLRMQKMITYYEIKDHVTSHYILQTKSTFLNTVQPNN